MKIKKIAAGLFAFAAVAAVYTGASRISAETVAGNDDILISDTITMLAPALSEAEINALPERYDLREHGLVSEVKNQGDFGTCWTFAASGALETSLIKKEPFVDLSEFHLAYFSFFGDNTPDNIDTTDIIGGGHISVAAASYARWFGPVKEEVLPYDTVGEITPDPALQDRHDYLVTEMDAVNPLSYEHTKPDEMIRFSDDEIKQMITDGNAVTISMCYSEENYNRNTASYYDSKADQTNHAVLIVGYDDNFDRNNFKNTPPGDGAWIIKNSWGKNWADSGFFYLSYYDESIFNACSLKAEKAGRYQTNYQHDELFYTASVSPDRINPRTGYMANMFTAEKDEYITGAGFYTTDNNASYEISVCTGLLYDTDPSSGTQSSITAGTEKYAGYHTVTLAEPVKVKKGEKFAVICRLENPQNKCPIPVESVVTYAGFFNCGNYDTEIERTSSYGESFISSNGTNWRDTFGLILTEPFNAYSSLGLQYILGNVCLKAFGASGAEWQEKPADRKHSVLSSLTADNEALTVGNGSEDEPLTELTYSLPCSKDHVVLRPSGSGKIMVNGKEVISGHESEKISVGYGITTVKITSSEKGLEDTEYTLKIKRDNVLPDYINETISIRNDRITEAKSAAGKDSDDDISGITNDGTLITVTAPDGHILKDGESISEYLGEDLTVYEGGTTFTLHLEPRKSLFYNKDLNPDNVLSVASETIDGLYSSKRTIFYSSSPDMSDAKDVHDRIVGLYGTSEFRVYPGYDSDLYFQAQADERSPKSDVVCIHIPERPVITDDDITINFDDDNSFSFSLRDPSPYQTIEYEVCLKSDEKPALSGSDRLMHGNRIDEAVEVSGLLPGHTYCLYTRILSTDETPASTIHEFTFTMPGEKPDYVIDYKQERLVFDESEFTVKYGDKEFHCYDSLSDYTSCDLIICPRDGDPETDSEIIHVPERRAAPDIYIDYNTGCIKNIDDYDLMYLRGTTNTADRDANRANMLSSDSSKTVSLEDLNSWACRPGETLNFFYVSSEGNFASAICPIVIPKLEIISKDLIKITGITDDEIRLEEHEGLEYACYSDKKRKFIWQDSPVFSGLDPDTSYMFGVRYKITEDKLFSSTVCATAETLKADYRAGDLNGDGNCTVIDLLILRRILFGTLDPDQSQLRSSDINSDGTINVLDHQRLLSEILK
ncbi:MAG: hypothetical protein IJL67_10610 [Oscillospiraceae bacterium]|nr:hypothetical protein [Oscillospiraceae bacterium]